jgi:hypothetical protein
MPRPDHDTMMRMIRHHFSEAVQKALTHTRWKDGIDVDYPCYAIEAFAEDAAASIPLPAKHLHKWHDDFGPVLWWKFPVKEPPYAGTPLDHDWPGYHTHWTPMPAIPIQPPTE